LKSIYEGLHLKSNRTPALKNWEMFQRNANQYYFAQREADMKNRDRVFAKCIRGGNPSEKMDALLG